MTWQFAEAKKNLNEVVTRAVTEGPQRIHYRGEVVVVLSEEGFERLSEKRESFSDYLLHGPDLSDLDLSRDQPPMREM